MDKNLQNHPDVAYDYKHPFTNKFYLQPQQRGDSIYYHYPKTPKDIPIIVEFFKDELSCFQENQSDFINECPIEVKLIENRLIRPISDANCNFASWTRAQIVIAVIVLLIVLLFFTITLSKKVRLSSMNWKQKKFKKKKKQVKREPDVTFKVKSASS